MTIKGIICDFGGVLVLFNDQGSRKKWATRLGLEHGEMIDALFNSETAFKAITGKISEDEFWEYHRQQFGLSKLESTQLRKEIFIDDQLNTELINFIAELPDSLKKAILSNAFLGARHVFTNEFHLDKVFDQIIISAEEGIAKPDDDIYLLTARRMNLDPWELLFIDDMQINSQAAAKVGMAAIHFQDTSSTIHQISSLLKSHGIKGI
jgi:epoxide hydrolase-like predicted phosphatase